MAEWDNAYSIYEFMSALDLYMPCLINVFKKEMFVFSHQTTLVRHFLQIIQFSLNVFKVSIIFSD